MDTNNLRLELDRAMRDVGHMGSERLKAIADTLDTITTYSRSSQQFKDDSYDVVAFLRKWAVWLKQDKGEGEG